MSERFSIVIVVLCAMVLPTAAQAGTPCPSFLVSSSAAGGQQFAVAVADFNGDGRKDLAVANTGTNTVSILLNNGNGTFAAPVSYGVGNTPYYVAVGDFNGDGKPDVVTVNFGTSDASILLNNGDGTFGTAVNYPAGNSPFSVSVGDFNGDGHLDLAVANPIDSAGCAGGCVSILLGNGNGGFALPVTYSAGGAPNNIAIADFNGDGKPDLAVANTTSNDVSILLNNGDGTFGAANNFAAGSGPYAVTVGDFNGDGYKDLAVANANSTGVSGVSVLLGVGNGTFGAANSYGAGNSPHAVAVGDFNLDGKEDLAVANELSNTVSFLPGDGTGGFGVAVSYSVGVNPYSVAVADFNGDGADDVAVGVIGVNNISILLNQPVTTPTIVTTESVPVSGTGSATVAAIHTTSTYSWSLSGGTITSGQGTGTIQYSAGSPGTRMTLSVTETNSIGCGSVAATTHVMVDFLDVPPSYLFHDFVIKLAINGITAGCGGGNYCPDNDVLRSQMAIFLLRGEHGEAYAPPPATGIFADVPVGSFAADFIEQLYNEGITGGCGTSPLRYCPSNSVLRSQMAIFLLRAQHGSAYTPPTATGIFADVPVGSFAADFIEQLYNEGITGGCGTSPLRYCPNASVTRGAMAVFLTRTFNLQ